MNKFIIAAVLSLSALGAQAASSVVYGLSSKGDVTLKSFGNDVVTYDKRGRMTNHCTFLESQRGIDNAGSPFVLDMYDCTKNKNLFIKTFRTLEDGGYVFTIETIRGEPVTTWSDEFVFGAGESM